MRDLSQRHVKVVRKSPDQVYYYHMKAGRRLSDDPAEREAEVIALNGQHYRRLDERRRQYARNAIARAFRLARKRSKTNKTPYEISPAEEASIAQRAGGCCEVTGIPFTDAIEFSGYRNPYAPSLDRIDPQAGYTPTNVRLVLVAVNTALNDFGLEVFLEIAEAALKRNRPGAVSYFVRRPSPLHQR